MTTSLGNELVLNAIKRHVAAAIGQVGQPKIGVVTSVDPSTYTARVTIQPEGVLSGWLPIGTAMVGGGYGVVSTPSPGEQVLLLPTEGNTEHAVIIARIFSQAATPPKTFTDQYNQGDTSFVQPGEVALVHQSGAFLRLINGTIVINGNVTVNGTVHATNTITSDVDVVAVRDVVADRNISSTGNTSGGGFISAAKDVDAGQDVNGARNVNDFHGPMGNLRNHYNSHSHPDPQGGNVGPTTQPD